MLVPRVGAAGGVFCKTSRIAGVLQGQQIDCGYQMDLVVENAVLLELKSCEKFEPIHQAQLLTLPQGIGLKLGLLLNFNVPVMRDGIRRIVNALPE